MNGGDHFPIIFEEMEKGGAIGYEKKKNAGPNFEYSSKNVALGRPSTMRNGLSLAAYASSNYATGSALQV